MICPKEATEKFLKENAKEHGDIEEQLKVAKIEELIRSGNDPVLLLKESIKIKMS